MSKPVSPSAALPVAHVVLRILIVLNWLGGAAILALPSTGRDGQASRIVPRLAPGAAVTSPRFLADWVVTEHGVAALRGKGEQGRARALLAVAHPRFRGELERVLTSS